MNRRRIFPGDIFLLYGIKDKIYIDYIFYQDNPYFVTVIIILHGKYRTE